MPVRIENKHDLRAKRRVLADQRRKFPAHLVEIPREEWSDQAKAAIWQPLRVWQSKDFAVHLWTDPRNNHRLTVCRTEINNDGSWKDGITWDDLQRLKAEAGYGDWWAVEVYPPAAHLIHDANMRHLWILNEAPPYAWKRH